LVGLIVIANSPLELQEVAEIKFVLQFQPRNETKELRAIIPDLLRFGYIPADQIKLNSSDAPGSARSSSPTYALPSAPILDEEEHVLVLEFVESTKRYKAPECVRLYGVFPGSSLYKAGKCVLVASRNDGSCIEEAY
jgi:DEAD/DEAH box helicase domain-containing protein